MWSDLKYRLRALFRRQRVEQELDEEMRLHLEHQTRKHIAAGRSPQEAARLARLEFGGIEQIKEDSRDARGVLVIESFLRDLQYAARFLGRSPSFTVVTVASLALGVGANTAIFQLLDAVRLRSLPIEAPQQLVTIQIPDMSTVRGSRNRNGSVTNAIWEEIRTRQQVFSGVIAWADDRFDISPGGDVRPVRGLWVSGGFFDVLGVRPAAGRLFTNEDDRRGCGLPGAVLSEGFWQSEYSGDPGAIGRTIPIGGHPVPIIGVAPASFFGLEVGRGFDIALPNCGEDVLHGAGSRLSTAPVWWLTVMGRLKPGMTLERATAQLQAISPAIFAAAVPTDYPLASLKAFLDYKLIATPAAAGISSLRERYSEPLFVLLALAALVLLIACTNLANLLIARASTREREIAIRLSIGASRGALVRQLLTESLLIATIGAAAGVLAGAYLSRWLVSLLSTDENRIFLELHLDWRLVAFAAGLAIITCILSGLAPALQATRQVPGTGLKAGRGTLGDQRRLLDLRKVLVVSQLAISFVLLFGALLFAGTFRNLLSAETGFRQSGVLLTNVNLERLGLPREALLPFKNQLLARIRSLNGVELAAETAQVPLSGNAGGNRARIDGEPPEKAQGSYRAQIGSDYFKTLGTPLLAGREFTEADTKAAPFVAIVNQEFARQFGLSNPIGRHFWVEASPNRPETRFEIVGVVRNAKYLHLREDMTPVMFLALSQDPRTPASAQILIRSSAPMEQLVPTLRTAISQLNPNVQFSFHVWAAQIEAGLVRERMLATLSSYFGLVAGLLAAIGLYGVIAYSVAKRQNEIGVRMALGADRHVIRLMILKETTRLVAIGLAAGVLLSFALGRMVGTLLYGVAPTDPWTLVVSAAILAVIAIFASSLPAQRAARLDPLVALRQE